MIGNYLSDCLDRLVRAFGRSNERQQLWLRGHHHSLCRDHPRIEPVDGSGECFVNFAGGGIKRDQQRFGGGDRLVGHGITGSECLRHRVGRSAKCTDRSREVLRTLNAALVKGIKLTLDACQTAFKTLDQPVASGALTIEAFGNAVDDLFDRRDPVCQRIGAGACGRIERRLRRADESNGGFALRGDPLACGVHRACEALDECVNGCRHVASG